MLKSVLNFSWAVYIEYSDNYDWISTKEQILKNLFYYII